MLEKERQIRLVGKLFKLTNAGELVWEAAHDHGLTDDNLIHAETYKAKYGELEFEIWPTRSMREPVDSDTGPIAFIGRNFDPWTGRKKKRWLTVTQLQVKSLRDGGVETIYDIEDMPLMRMLYYAAKKSVTSIDADIEAFIGQEERHAERHHG